MTEQQPELLPQPIAAGSPADQAKRDEDRQRRPAAPVPHRNGVRRALFSCAACPVLCNNYASVGD